jgi:hypothetical protein
MGRLSRDILKNFCSLPPAGACGRAVSDLGGARKWQPFATILVFGSVNRTATLRRVQALRMMVRLTKVFRRRAATMLAALYALCVFAPAMAFAVGGSALVADGLASPAHGVVQPHSHDADSARLHDHGNGFVHYHGSDGSHQHPEGGDGEPAKATSNCCGVMCVPALAAALPEAFDAPLPSAAVILAAGSVVAASGPKLPYRPPIV